MWDGLLKQSSNCVLPQLYYMPFFSVHTLWTGIFASYHNENCLQFLKNLVIEFLLYFPSQIKKALHKGMKLWKGVRSQIEFSKNVGCCH